MSQDEVGVDVHRSSLTLTWCVLDLILGVGAWLDTWSGCGGEILVCRTWCSQHPLPLICHPSLQGGSCGEDTQAWICAWPLNCGSLPQVKRWSKLRTWLQAPVISSDKCPMSAVHFELSDNSTAIDGRIYLSFGYFWRCRVVLSCNFICYNHQRRPNIKQQQYYHNVFTNPLHMRENLFLIQCSEWGVDTEKRSKKGLNRMGVHPIVERTRELEFDIRVARWGLWRRLRLNLRVFRVRKWGEWLQAVQDTWLHCLLLQRATRIGA